MAANRQEIAKRLRVIAREPFGIYYDDEATSVSASNKVGQFDILPGHADFFSILESGDVIIENETKPTVINIKNGIITVQNNEVMLFLNI